MEIFHVGRLIHEILARENVTTLLQNMGESVGLGIS
jgi:hypothetical protein